MGLNSQSVQTNAAFKNLYGKSLTDAVNKGIGNEADGLFISVPSSKVFIQAIDADPAQAIIDGVVQLVSAELQPDPTSNSHAFVTTLAATISSGPGVLTIGKKYYATSDSSSDGVSYNAGDSFIATSEDLDSGSVKERVLNLIDPKYGPGYEAVPKIGATPIPVDDPKLWIYQYDSGVFFQEVVTGGTPTAISVYQYIGTTLLDANPGLTVTEDDASPSINNVKEIRFSNGTVVDLGNGIIQVATGGITGIGVREQDLSPNLIGITTLEFPSGSVVDLGGGIASISFGVGTMSSFNILGDSGSPQAVSDGQTVTIEGTANIDTTSSSPRTITIDLADTTVTPGIYGSSADVAQIAIDQKGRITSVTNFQIDHNLLLNYNVNQHRVINDLGTSTTVLFSASKILSLFTAATNNADVKDSVVTVATTDETLSGVGQTISGYVVQSGDRIGVVGQTDPIENGIYVADAGAWTRSEDADEDDEVTNGMTFFVSKGDNAGYQYILTNADPVIPGTDALSFTEVPRITLGTTSGTAAEGNDPRIPTQDENDALVGTGTPSAANPYVTRDSISITDDFMPRGTGTGIEDGTWLNVGNDIYPNVTGSNIGDSTHRIGTLYMSSNIDFSTNLLFASGGTTRLTLSTSGDLTVPSLKAVKFGTEGVQVRGANAADGYISGSRFYEITTDAVGYLTPWFYMNTEYASAKGIIQFSMGGAASMGFTYAKAKTAWIQTSHNNIFFLDHQGTYTGQNNESNQNAVGFINGYGTSTATLRGAVAIAGTGLVMATNWTLYTNNIDVQNGLAKYSGTGNDIADITAATAKVLVTKEWVQANGDGNGIYDGSGTMSGTAVVTMGTNMLQFLGTSASTRFEILQPSIGIGTTSTSSYKINLLAGTGQHALQVVTDGSANTMRIFSTGEILMNGNLGVGLTALGTSTAKLHVRGSGTTSSTTTALFEDSAGNDIVKVRDDGRVGIGTAPDFDGKLHVYSGTAGAVTAHSLADDIVVESSSDVGISLLGSTAAYIIFGNTTSNNEANIQYVFGSGLMNIRVNAQTAVSIDGAKNFGIGTSSFGTSAANVFSLAIGTAPTTEVADTVRMYTTTGLDLIIRDETGAEVDLFSVGASSLSTTLGFGNTSESNDIVLVSATAVTDGALINSDKVVLRAQYDADPTAGVTPTDYDADIQHIVDTGGATPASHLNVRLNGISRATLSDTGFMTLFHGAGTNKGLKVTNNSNYGVYLGEVAGTRSYIGFNSFYRNSGWWQSETTSAATVEYYPAGYLRWTVATGLTANVDYSTDTAEKMRLTTTGLGIGTTTVSSRLHVKGSGTTSSTTTLLVENFSGQDVIVGYDNSAVTVGTRSAGTIGGYSFVAGKDNKATNAASNAASYALGIGNDSSGIFSGALGAFNIASGRSSLATGEGNTASGDYSFSAGQNNSIAGAHSFGAGNNVTITNRLTFAYGYGLNSTADQACIIGRGGDAALNRLANPHQYSLMIGFRSEIPTLFISDSGGIGKVGNVGVGTTVFGSNAESVLGIKIKTAPTTAPADMIQLYAKDSSDGAANATLALQLEQAVEAIGTFTPSHKLKVWINGVEYWIQLDAV